MATATPVRRHRVRTVLTIIGLVGRTVARHTRDAKWAGVMQRTVTGIPKPLSHTSTSYVGFPFYSPRFGSRWPLGPRRDKKRFPERFLFLFFLLFLPLFFSPKQCPHSLPPLPLQLQRYHLLLLRLLLLLPLVPRLLHLRHNPLLLLPPMTARVDQRTQLPAHQNLPL